jgi:hypothetical protein
MRQGCVLLMGLFFGGCILEGPTTTWLGRPRLLQGPTGSDVIQLDVAVLEGSVGNRPFNRDLWTLADEQGIPPEIEAVLEANGLRVGQIGGLAPPELQTLLASERSCVRSRRIQLRSGTPRTLVLGPAVTQGRFEIHENGHDIPVTLDKSSCVLRVIPTLAADGRTRLQFIPEVQRKSTPVPAANDAGSPAWERAASVDLQGRDQESSQRFASLSWEITLPPNDYLLIGGRYDRPNTLGWQSFIRTDEDAPVQRLLVIRTTRSSPSVETEIASSPSRKPISYAQSPSLAAQASATPPRGNGP